MKLDQRLFNVGLRCVPAGLKRVDQTLPRKLYDLAVKYTDLKKKRHQYITNF